MPPRGGLVLIAAAAGGCRPWGFVERPGSLRVEALAGCTWTQTGDDGIVETWTYDERGRLTESTETGPDEHRMVATWRGDCLAEQQWLRLDTDEPARVSSSGYNTQVTTCDRRGNPTRRDELVRTGNGDEWMIASRSYENTYGGDWLARVDRWTEPGFGAERELIDTTEYGWVDVRKPLWIRVTQLTGTTTTTSYWWDHDLLRGLTFSGGGVAVDVTRTFEDKRLVEEVVSQGEEEILTLDWSFAEDAEYPYAQQAVGVDAVSHDIAVDCG